VVTISLEPIGIINTPYNAPYDAPRQPRVDDRVDEAVITLTPHRNFEQALDDLDGCERIWLITHFHRAQGWKPRVLVPRGRTKRGVFATRSPHRPNNLGLTCVELVRVEGLSVYVRGTDLLDGTPVLDIKPYVAYADAFPSSTIAWLDDVEALPSYTIVWQNDVLHGGDSELRAHVERVLAADPHPHPYRRIECIDDGLYELAVRDQRFRFRIDDTTVTILA
jgi:tRNA-Thr(GGU) m(6)t(6)A37 methyltransferase TsaA